MERKSHQEKICLQMLYTDFFAFYAEVVATLLGLIVSSKRENLSLLRTLMRMLQDSSASNRLTCVRGITP